MTIRRNGEPGLLGSVSRSALEEWGWLVPMTNLVERGFHLVPIYITPHSSQTQRNCNVFVGHRCVSCGFIWEALNDLNTVNITDDGDRRSFLIRL